MISSGSLNTNPTGRLQEKLLREIRTGLDQAAKMELCRLVCFKFKPIQTHGYIDGLTIWIWIAPGLTGLMSFSSLKQLSQAEEWESTCSTFRRGCRFRSN